jgi:predicted transcriptional regulator
MEVKTMLNTNELRGAIRDALDREGWTIPTLAAHARLPTSTITRILKGEVQSVQERTVAKLRPYISVRHETSGMVAIPKSVWAKASQRVRYVGTPTETTPNGETVVIQELPQEDGARVMVHDGDRYYWGRMYRLQLVVTD